MTSNTECFPGLASESKFIHVESIRMFVPLRTWGSLSELHTVTTLIARRHSMEWPNRHIGQLQVASMYKMVIVEFVWRFRHHEEMWYSAALQL